MNAFETLVGGSSDPDGAATRMLIRTAGRLASAQMLDYEGTLFSTICIALGCCCKLSGARLAAAHWARAISDGRSLDETASGAFDLRSLALQRLVASGVLGPGPAPMTWTTERREQLQQALQPLMTLLVAYALRCDLAHDPAVVNFRTLLFPH